MNLHLQHLDQIEADLGKLIELKAKYNKTIELNLASIRRHIKIYEREVQITERRLNTSGQAPSDVREEAQKRHEKAMIYLGIYRECLKENTAGEVE
jgi:hypothetical protein